MKVIALFALVAFAFALSWPKEYYLHGTMSMPYVNLTIPVAVDEKNGQQMVDIYDGKQKTFFVPNTGLYTSYIAKDHRECTIATDGEQVPVLPDMTLFKKLDGTVRVNGVVCDHYRYQPTQYQRICHYDLYVNHQTQAPVQFKMLGQNLIWGSHYDIYVLDVDTFVAGFSKRLDFDLPSECQNVHTEEPVSGAYAMLQSFFSTPIASETGDAAFDSFAAEHGRHYSASEAAHRRAVFEHNHAYILATNAMAERNDPTALVLKVNEHADKTLKEVLRGSTGHNARVRDETLCNHPDYTYSAARNTPASVDWRVDGVVSPRVPDQAFCGSCWTFGATGAIEGRIAVAKSKKTGAPVEAVVLSKQAIVDCFWDTTNLGCMGGTGEAAFHWMWSNKIALPTEVEYPYLGVNDYCHFDTSASAAPTIDGCAMISAKDVKGLKQAIAEGPVSVAIAVPMSFVFYDHGIFKDNSCGQEHADLEHAVLAVGYGSLNGKDFAIVRNSWSTHWGNNGYIYMDITDDYNNCGIATEAKFPTVSV
ncbi:cysteine proteinase [Carpediemonas membranifera]|uniref:Cysteine proteinase n=1 Tax=Carpediemonas membranifera TaxID=201153 RepID=A0A8J6AZG3_9EUKA|nr:cysteine proteinase [Carpediemonas membranifera]|eukprot:KAG9392163.1 cysteine proteinase [Carpediemonas membranifera]